MRLVTATALSLASVLPAGAAPLSYNRDVRPILSENCFSCHGPDKNTREAKLRLDLRESAMKRKVLKPGEPDRSELIYRVTTDDEDDIMPPPNSHKTLDEKQKKILTDWIAQGAEYEGHWAYLKPTRPPVPDLGEAHPIDNFILASQATAAATLSPPADPQTLARRLSFDLTGLPPTPEDLASLKSSILHPPSTIKAREAGVDKLLNSPHFGERMAVFWLDLARYADSAGYHSDKVRDVTPYRDYVIASFNNNKPYDRFVTEQLAGDLLENPTTEHYVASAFNRVSQASEEGGIQDAEYISKYYAERVRTTSVAFLGSTMGCAECHDHKFDPFTMKDFYSMEAFFADIFEKGAYNGDGRYNEGAKIEDYPGFRLDKWGPAMDLPSPEQQKQLARIEREKKSALADLAKDPPELETAFSAWLTELRSKAESGGKKGKELAALPDKARKALAGGDDEPLDGKLRAELLAHYRKIAPALEPARKRVAKLEKEEKTLRSQIRSTLVTLSAKPREIRVLPRGNWMDKSGEVVPPAVPAFLTSVVAAPDTGSSAEASAKAEHPRQTRLDLANWIASPDNPLTARAFVNRLWALFFDTGLSRDLQDLGNQGQWPTHPELLDWLAVEFIDSGWDVKHMVRLIVTSKTYQQSSNAPKALTDSDPYNELYARQNARRLPAEFVRDNALAVSNLLNDQIGGASARPYQPAGYYAQLNFPKRKYQQHNDANQYRRGLYMHWQRSFLHPMLAAFDAPAREECTAYRANSNTPLQSLNLLNDPTFIEAARVFAENLVLEHEEPALRIESAFQQLLSRHPTSGEIELLTDLYGKQLNRYRAAPADAKALITIGLAPPCPEIDPADLAATTTLTRTLLNLHETITTY